MSYSYSFRDRPRLSDRIRGKSGDELFNELRKELDQDRKSFFTSPSSSPTNFGASSGSSFPRAGHLFDDPSMRGHFDVKSHLEDLAQRHPEFADQLRYPAWSNDNRTNSWGRKRRGSGQPEGAESNKQQPQQEAQPSQQQPETQESSQQEESTPLRGRPREDLRNTVPDMGQKQQQEGEQESRGQRSWSAPPDNRTQQQEKPRFVSKIEITPVNPDAAQSVTGDAQKPPMAPPKPQPQPQQTQQPHPPTQPKSNVRHIPIFVEGRDEPVLPKNIEPELFTQTHAPQSFTRPPPQAQFNHYQQQPTARKQQTAQQPFDQPPPQPRFEQHHQQQQQAQPPHKPEPTPVPQQEQHPEPPKVNVNDPLYRVSCVQKDVDELRAQVDAFIGTSRSDKQYIMLDEFLTRNLIKLDNIETEGKEEVRAARKNAIKSIQEAISVLENKVPVPGSEQKEDVMDMEPMATNDTQGNESSVSNPSGETKENPSPANTAETTATMMEGNQTSSESTQQPVSSDSAVFQTV